MNQEEKLKERYGNKGCWKVPEGYFEQVYKEIGEKLPERKESRATVDMTLWQRVKPYVYLAAMFAGIWLMMKVFYHASGSAQLNLDNPPEHIALAMSDTETAELYSISESINDIEVESEVSDSYDSLEEFERDFGYALEPEYANLRIVTESEGRKEM